MRIFLDANVIFSAAATSGAVRRLLNDLVRLHHTLVVDEYVWEEARRNLTVHKPVAIKQLHELSTILELHSGSLGTKAVGEVLPGVTLTLPEKDIPVIVAAVELECSVLMTGDRTHFSSMYRKKAGGLSILSPRGGAELLLGESAEI